MEKHTNEITASLTLLFSSLYTWDEPRMRLLFKLKSVSRNNQMNQTAYRVNKSTSKLKWYEGFELRP